MANFVDVNPKLLRWAVERSGLPLEEFPSLVANWLAGQKKPTLKQLEKFAQRAMVPFGYLFLKDPPDEALPIPDYRTRTDGGVPRPSPNLIETIFEMQRRQDWMREFLIDEGHGELPFVGSASANESTVVVAQRMYKALGIERDWAAGAATWKDALRLLRERIENAGILIFVNGIVGNNTHRTLDPDEFQGFVLADKIAPLIFVNGADFKVAQMFTIAHELAHVWLGQDALFDLDATESPNIGIEQYCNSVAAEFLVPAEKLKSVWATFSHRENAFVLLARHFKVSQVVVARRAKDLGLVAKEEFFSFYAQYMQRERQKQEDRSDGGDFWQTQNVRLGRRFGSAVIAAARSGRISYTEAFDLTRLRGETFDKYVRLLAQEGRA